MKGGRERGGGRELARRWVVSCTMPRATLSSLLPGCSAAGQDGGLCECGHGGVPVSGG